MPESQPQPQTAGSPQIRQMLLDQISEPESLVEFAHQDQATGGSDSRALEIDLEGGVKGELKRLV